MMNETLYTIVSYFVAAGLFIVPIIMIILTVAMFLEAE